MLLKNLLLLTTSQYSVSQVQANLLTAVINCKKNVCLYLGNNIKLGDYMELLNETIHGVKVIYVILLCKFSDWFLMNVRR